ncbi:MAG: PEGA domain-containing protein, partial [Treponema sp.]|nr:PEGA domain-containing protein [Treponema sp.]
MKHKPCFLFFAIFCFSFVVFSQPHNEQFLIAEAVTEVQKSSASVTIHSNVRNASVYLNGQYYGTTPCTVTDLAPGTYRLRITKQGYNSVSHYISVSRKQSSSFYVELERLVGFIRLHGVPENASVYCDDTLISSYGVTGTIELPEGYHTITVRKFGYADFVTSLYVTRRLITPLHVSMRSETFSLSNFSASKKQINPTYTNSLGTCNFSFKVTAPESANLSITDENGIVVYSYNFPTFTTWEQKVAWNGRSVTGEVLPDGVYCATLSAGDYTEKVYVQINSALRYHVADISFSGSSIGNLPAPFTQGEKTFFLGLGVSPAFIVQKDAPFYGIPINFFFGFNPVSWFEFSSSLTLNTGNMGEDGTNVTVPVMMNVSAKFSTQIPLQTGGQFSVGGVVRYGGTLNGSLKHSKGEADTGNGFALGLAV